MSQQRRLIDLGQAIAILEKDENDMPVMTLLWTPPDEGANSIWLDGDVLDSLAYLLDTAQEMIAEKERKDENSD